MDRDEILTNVESLLKTAGSSFSMRCCTRRSCFDYVARRERQVTFLKAHPKIGNVSKKDAVELATLAEAFSGGSLFICEESRNKPLEEDTVYSRYNVAAVTLGTLENTFLKGMEPLIEAGPGGYYVTLDGEAIREKRLDKGLSMGKMAEITGVSRRTLYGYEKGMAKASVSTAYKLEWILGIPVVKPVNISRRHLLATAKRIISESRVLQFFVKKLLEFNFAVFHVKRAPFDLVAKNEETGTTLLGSVVTKQERNLKLRAEEIVSVSKILEAQPILISKRREVYADNIPLLCREDFERIRCPEDFTLII